MNSDSFKIMLPTNYSLINNEKESKSMRKIEKQNNPKAMNFS